MSKAQHFRAVSSHAAPTASDLSELLELGWDTVSIVRDGQGSYITYLKRLSPKEPK